MTRKLNKATSKLDKAALKAATQAYLRETLPDALGQDTITGMIDHDWEEYVPVTSVVIETYLSERKSETLAALEARKEQNKSIKRKNNSSLYAGSPMYYYCKLCGAQMTRPEGHFEPAPSHCDPCKQLYREGYID